MSTKNETKSDDLLDQESLDQVILALQTAKQIGFSTPGHSSALVLLDGMIDLSMLLSQALRSAPKDISLNPSLKETDLTDSLGNQKILKIREFRKDLRNPQAGKFIFNQLIPFLVQLKQGKSFDTAYSMLAKRKSSFYNSPETPVINQEVSLVANPRKYEEQTQEKIEKRIGLDVSTPIGSFSFSKSNSYYSNPNLWDISNDSVRKLIAQKRQRDPYKIYEGHENDVFVGNGRSTEEKEDKSP